MHASHELQANLSQVLVVGKSPVNRVVITKIVERSGLKPVSETPEEALKSLTLLRPGLVIVDGGAANSDCEDILAALRDRRRISSKNLPIIILLSTAAADAPALAIDHGVDAVVAKPITTESLQPVIDRLMSRARA
ncbi:Response regulator receiver domain-containing protein [Mesorhizobium albiziae]|uniref:Response regulator receiver domain-containing protein n=1 Tax=Neomesorhizobium albiziae TaxID=335020 RepID=A0A1I4B7F7_9HYPH|nr:response regulator [Mesorhizobium albiziae]GLS34332.1 response regulator [Mesorhizobium albiziae]SFK63806.1 Response regulator receiver domain-containing protein [Mesorhizobium albiziae]